MLCLIQNKDWYLAQRFMLSTKLKTHTKINALSSNSSLQREDSYPERARFALEADNWYLEYESFDQSMNRLSYCESDSALHHLY